MRKFWDSWKNKSELENQLIFELESAKSLLEKENFLSVYVKGTFPRRELIHCSDVDVFLVYKDDDYESDIAKLKKALRNKGLHRVSVSGYSISELERGFSFSGKNTTRFTKHLYQYELLLGEDLSKKRLKKRGDKEDFYKMIKAFEEIFLVKYGKQEMSFHDLVKQVFWLADNELRFLGLTPKKTWKGLSEQIKSVSESHIFLEAFVLREKIGLGKKILVSEKESFLRNLKAHLSSLKSS